LRDEKFVEQRLALIDRAAEETAGEFESLMYYSLQCVLANITKVEALENKSLNDALYTECSMRLTDGYPQIAEEYTIIIEKYRIMVIEDWSMLLPDRSDHDIEFHGAVPVYLKLVGTGNFVIKLNGPDNVLARKIVRFDRVIPVPLPLLLNSVNIFKAQSDGSYSNIARLTQYILTTTVQMRILSGYGINDEPNYTNDIITDNDVENAVNLAVVLEQVRLFRTYDSYTAESLGLTGTFRKYLNCGEVDGADLYFIMNKMQLNNIDLGKIIAEAIRSYSDEFMFRLLTTFLPDETLDAILQEPLFDWERLKQKGEDFAKQKLNCWLQKFKSWMFLPPYIFTHFGSGTIPTLSQHADSVDCASKFPVTLPVRGYYDIFSMPYAAKWFVFTGGIHLDDEQWPPAQLAIDPVDMIIGEASDSDLKPKPYEITFFSNFGLPEQIKYYLVNQSFIALFSEKDSSTPYFDCLKYILETIRGGITTKPYLDQGEGADGQGLIDLMAREAKTLTDLNTRDLCWEDLIVSSVDPTDKRPVLTGGMEQMLDGPLTEALTDIRDLVRGQELSSMIPGSGSWFENGLLKKSAKEGGLYNLFKDTVDLFYELFWTLKQSCSADAGKFDGNWAWNLPESNFAPIDKVQEKGSRTDHFNFKRDAVMHAYNSVWTIVLLHMIPTKNYFHPDVSSVGEFNSATPPIPELAWFWYGHDRYPGDASASNLRLWDDVHRAVRKGMTDAFGPKKGIRLEIDLGLISLNLTTDSRDYGPVFHEFLWLYIGRELLNPPGVPPEGTMEQLVGSGSGWLDTMLLKTLSVTLSKYIDYKNLILITPSKVRYPYGFFKIYKGDDNYMNYQFSEQFRIDQDPTDLRNGRDMKITISEPILEGRFVSVQEKASNLSDAPFVTSWNICAVGCIGLTIKTIKNCMIRTGQYGPLILNETIPFNFNFTLTAFSGWPLFGHHYPMMQAVTVDNQLVYDRDLELSSKFLELMDTQIALEKEILERFDSAFGFIAEHPLGSLRDNPDSAYKPNRIQEGLQVLVRPVERIKFKDMGSDLDIINDVFEIHNLNRSIEFEFRHWGGIYEYQLEDSNKFYSTISRNEDLNGYFIQCVLDNNEHVIILNYNSNLLRLELTAREPSDEYDPPILLLAQNQRFNISTVKMDTFEILDDKKSIRGHLIYNNFNITMNVVLSPPKLNSGFINMLEQYPVSFGYRTIREAFEYNSYLIYRLERFLLEHPEISNDNFGVTFYYKRIDMAHAGKSKIEFCQISITEVENTPALIDYLRAIRAVQDDFITYLSGSNGVTLEALPPALFLQFTDKNLEQDTITITIGTINNQIGRIRINDATLDRWGGCSAIFNSNELNGREIIFIPIERTINGQHGLKFDIKPLDKYHSPMKLNRD
jgi:hypothetical protein